MKIRCMSLISYSNHFILIYLCITLIANDKHAVNISTTLGLDRKLHFNYAMLEMSLFCLMWHNVVCMMN